MFDGVGKLGTGRAEEFDPVVVERIVRRADHDASGQTERAREVGHGGRGQRPGKIDIDTRRGQSGFERRLE